MKLSTKISLISILTVFTFTLMLGVYFNTFLKSSYFKKSKDKINHAATRVLSNFKNTENELIQGLNYIEDDEAFIASIALINNYQDKNNYNSALLDEEKKELVKYLLDKIKTSFNDNIILYDKNGDLLAYVYKKNKHYVLNFISYENAKQIIYSKDESALEYTKHETIKEKIVTLHHIPYYSQKKLKNGTILTYHQSDNKIYIIAHHSIFNKENPNKVNVHMEMSKEFGNDYFKNLSYDLDLDVFISNAKKYQKKSIELRKSNLLDNSNIIDDIEHYSATFSIPTQDKNTFLIFRLDKSSLHAFLNQNRKQLIIFLLVAIAIIIILFHLLIHVSITTPLGKVMKQISKIKEGDYTPSTLVSTSDELEVVSHSINNLATSLMSRERSLKASQTQLEYLSTHDELTGLLNRRTFSIKLKYALQKAQRNKTQVAVLFLDLDDFKQVNDTLGHSAGDALLQAVAQRLEKSLRKSDVLARVGGDEFNIFVEGFKTIAELQIFAQKILDNFIEPFVYHDSEIVSSTSIGLALYPNDGQDTETLTKNADLAMYKSKDNGRNGYSFYSRTFSDYLQHRMDIVQSLKGAIKNDSEFVLHYQPKISIETEKIVGVEALIRWNSPELGFVRPDEFISIAEDTHMIIDIGYWVLQQACSDFIKLKEQHYSLPQISINVSGVQLQYSDMLQTIQEIIATSNIKASELELEVTESYIATNEIHAIETLSSFRGMGIALAIDDFGTGYSSMSYLQSLPISRLKIDKAFVDDLPNSQKSVAVVKAIIALAQAFELKITVEGVESKEQLDFFKGKYCDDIQGYYYSKPLTFHELKEFIKEHS